MRTISGTSRTISEYFEDTLATEPGAVVDFLLKTSILNQMNGALCSAVAGTADGASMLEALEREQFLLVPLDESRQLVSVSPSAARVSAGPAAHQDGRPNPRPLSPGLSLVCRTRDVERGGPIRDRGRGLPAGHRVHRELRDVHGGQRRPPDVAELGAASAQGADELPARGQARPCLGHEPRHPLQRSRRAADAGRGRHTRKPRQRSVVEVSCGARGILRPRRRQRARQGPRHRVPRRAPVRFVQLQRALQRSALRLLEGG